MVVVFAILSPLSVGPKLLRHLSRKYDIAETSLGSKQAISGLSTSQRVREELNTGLPKGHLLMHHLGRVPFSR